VLETLNIHHAEGSFEKLHSFEVQHSLVEQRMPRHSKNNCSGSVFTHYERREAAVNSGWGTQHVRLGKDALRGPDMCCLTLQPAINPVVTPQGFLFDKPALIEYYLAQKDTLKKKLAAWKQQQAIQEQQAHKEEEQIKKKKHDSFEKSEFSVLNNKKSSASSSSSSTSANLGSNFWLPQNTPEVSQVTAKPEMDVTCPMSGKPLKLTKLIECQFTPLSGASSSDATKRYMCPLSNKEITNAVDCVVLKPSGKVISSDSLESSVLNDKGKKVWKKYQELVKKDKNSTNLLKEDKQAEIGVDPFNNETLKISDVVLLRSEGTGYSGNSAVVVSTALAPAFVAS
jgi:nitric oxide synthase-interacting protein